MGAVDGEKPLDDGLGDLVWPEVPAATPAADKDEEGEYEEAGQRKTTKLPDPLAPTAAERAEHELTHIPYRSWCSCCVKGRGRQADHRTSKSEGALHELHVDFCFMGAEGEDDKLTILVLKEKKTKMSMATVVPSKSTEKKCSRETQSIFGRTWSRVCRRDC